MIGATPASGALRPACEALALAFEYPSCAALAALRSAASSLPAAVTDPSAALQRFLSHLDRLAPSGREELFTRTFDLNPACALEIGWHLYGENYERGAFLVWLREQHRALGVTESGELPDHLSYVLRAIGRLEGEPAAALAAATHTAIDRILHKLTDESNPYHEALRAVQNLLETNFALASAAPGAEGGARDA